MDEITIGDKVYVSSKQAAKITGYAKDYVGQLCREGRVEARLVGRNWYVLDASIREHRFGKSAETEPVSHTEKTEPEIDRSSTWKKPQYIAEEPVMVADLVPKQSENLGTPAIADMQSAWKEWFEEKRQPEALLEDGEENFKDELLPVLVAEDRQEAVLSPVEAVKEQVEESEMVVISRNREPLEPEENVQIENNVDLHRSYASLPRPEMVLRPRTMVPAAPLTAEKTINKKGTHGVGRSLIAVVAVMAILITIVGTGHADRLISGTSLDFGAQRAVIDFLAGKSQYKSSL